MNINTEGSTLPYAATARGGTYPAYATMSAWCALSGMSRSASYLALGRGDLRAVKVGTRTLVDVMHGLTWMSSLPPATIRPHGAAHRTTSNA